MLGAVRLVVLAAVAIGIAWAVRKGLADPAVRDLKWSDLRPLPLVAACLWYAAGTLPGWIYWHRIMQAFGQRPTRFESLRAFMIGQLGKYVPGKGLVVAIRADAVRSERTSAAAAAAAVFIETLTLMAVGATVAASILIFLPMPRGAADGLGRESLIALACLLMAVAGIPTWPPLFRRLVLLLRVDRADPSIRAAIDGLDGKLLLVGWGLNLIVWSCWGASLYAVLQAIPGVEPTLDRLPLLVACVALAMVAGFLSLLPGGVGVRELIILTLLAEFGPAKAIVAAVLLRLSWLLSETVIATILYPWHPSGRGSEDSNEITVSEAGKQ
ncbi:MAG TPA: lysylphosphatidylglycerol synthase transmembrane domain-containing protein [Pirellulaceae bacterium]|nr:lysylphosphatidylglycerol synthase transmembrane domain-containing protein [Pirellulaceae bacterium]